MKTSRSRLGVTVARTVAAWLLVAPTTVMGQEDLEETFSIGGSCAGLAYLTTSELHAVLDAGFPEDLHAFCTPEQPFECADYSPFLAGLGRMTTGDDGFHCAVSR